MATVATIRTLFTALTILWGKAKKKFPFVDDNEECSTGKPELSMKRSKNKIEGWKWETRRYFEIKFDNDFLQ